LGLRRGDLAVAGVSICPVAVVEAPLARVWSLLEDSSRYGDWVDAKFTSITPAGPAAPGQVLEADTWELGIRFHIRLTVQAVDPSQHRVGFTLQLPFGMTQMTNILCTAVDPRRTRVQFG
jgi:hypothetical protein